ncbi:MAG: hypothetical protein WCI95_05360 [bacterium]
MNSRLVSQVALVIMMAAMPWFLTSCITATATSEDIKKVDDSMELPAENVTKYSGSITQFENMLFAYNVRPLLVQTREIKNQTASKKVPEGIDQMVKTALASLGEKVRGVDIDRTELGIDLAVQTNSFKRVVPDVSLGGAITEYDEKYESSRELETDVLIKYKGDIDGGGKRESEAEAVTVAVDFQLLDYRTQTTLSKDSAQNRINIFKDKRGIDFGVSYAGSGFGFNASAKRSQGIHTGIRLLVELSVVEVLGKYYRLPYWRCLGSTGFDASLIDQLRKRYRRSLEAMPAAQALREMKILMLGSGYDVDPASSQLSAKELDQIRAAKTAKGLDPAGQNDYDLMVRLWETMPFDAAAAERARPFDALYAQESQVAQAEQKESQRQPEPPAATKPPVEPKPAAAPKKTFVPFVFGRE